jgi:long-chain acyl-CoA synthetase
VTGRTDADAGGAVADRDRLTEVGMRLSWWAARQPDRLAITSPAGTRTFGELNANANRLVRALRARGLRAGDAVALLCTNRPEFAEVVAACQRSGLRLTPINWHLNAEEAGYIAADCEAKALLVDARLVAPAGAVSSAQVGTVLLAIRGDLAGFESYEDALEAHAPEDLDDPSLGGLMLYTSGTTGRPKGVHRATPTTTTSTLNIYGYEEGGDDVHLCTGPLYHAAPLASPCWRRSRTGSGSCSWSTGTRPRRSASSRPTALPTRTWCRRCSTGSSPSRPGAATRTTCGRCGSSSTARRRARCR